MSDTPEITLYGNTWCGGSRRARLLFDRNEISYRWVDLDLDEEAAKYVATMVAAVCQQLSGQTAPCWWNLPKRNSPKNSVFKPGVKQPH
jgi:glutaredoxin